MKTLLAFGLDFCLPVYKLNFYRYFLKFESIASRLKNLRLPTSNYDDFINELHSLAYKYFYNFKKHKVFSSVFRPVDIKAIKNFASNPDIIICKPDKGRGVVILDKSTYIERITSIVSDATKFSVVDIPIDKYTRKIEDKLNNFLRSVKGVWSLDNNTLSSLLASGSAPGILYGLPKIHKPDFRSQLQFRPIFAAYNNPCFKLAKFLVPILQPYATNEHTIDNSASFVSLLKQFNNINSLYMSSFDIKILYTNIPVHETIRIILNLIFINSVNVFLGLTRNSFKTLLELASCNSFFVFNNILYKQIDGLGMGLLLGRQLPDDNRNMMISRSSGRSGFIYMVNV